MADERPATDVVAVRFIMVVLVVRFLGRRSA
jgi:hypothetical protein